MRYLFLALLLLAACSAPQQAPVAENSTVVPQINTTTSTFLEDAALEPEGIITYVMESNHPEEVQSAIVKIYRKGTTVRKDIKEDKGETRMLDNEACYDIGGDWACETRTMQTLRFEDLQQTILAHPSDYTLTPKGTRSLKKILASCTDITATDLDATYCVSQQGYVVYASLKEGEYTSVYQATKIEDIGEDALAIP